GECIERARKPHESVDLLMQRLERRSLRAHDAVAQCFQVALQVRKWRAQLVRRIGYELASHALLRFDLLGHAVERAREGTHLSWSALTHAHIVVALCHEPRGHADLAERRADAPSDRDREDRAG